MKIKGTCLNCNRDLLVRQLIDGGGHCPWCGRAISPDYTANLVEALRVAEDAGSALENALEKVSSTHARIRLDEESLVAGVRASVGQTGRREGRRERVRR